jgi:hypothetical protein
VLRRQLSWLGLRERTLAAAYGQMDLTSTVCRRVSASVSIALEH